MLKRIITIILIGMAVVPLFIGLKPAADAQTTLSFQTTGGSSRGYLTTDHELRQIRQFAVQGVEPYKSNVERLLRDAEYPTKWDYGSIGGSIQLNGSKQCYSPWHSRFTLFISENNGGQEVYRKAMAYYFSGREDYARNAREKILDLTDTYDYGGEFYHGDNQCIIMLGMAIPVWIQAADLLEGTPVWSTSDKQQFQRWLAQQVYPKLAWASRVRTNNWGTAGSLVAAMIADYLTGSGITLQEYSPQRLSLTPGQAYRQHNDMQIKRMTGQFRGDTQCSKYGIQWHGGIPDELRRGATGCLGEWIVSVDQSLSYQTMHVELLVFHAEFLLRRNDQSLYSDQRILKAIKFVIANPHQISTDWIDSRRGTMFVAYAYYRSWFLKEEAKALDTFKGGNVMPYGRLTHPLDKRTTVYTTNPPS